MKKIMLDPKKIEKKSFKIIDDELWYLRFKGLKKKLVYRAVHTTADFEYADILKIDDNVEEAFNAAVENGGNIICDTNMVYSGINKSGIKQLDLDVHCFISDLDIGLEAKELNITRSMVSMRKAASLFQNAIFAIGNAPTALYEVIRLKEEGLCDPALVIGVPVGFVGAAESKEKLRESGITQISTEGRKGGSPIAASLLNALIYNKLGKIRWI